jgi:hypothetical protein
MDSALLTTLISTGGAVITGVFGMFFTANQLGKRMDDLNNKVDKRIDDSNKQLGQRIDDLRISLSRDMDGLRNEIKEFRAEFYAFKEVVNGKFSALDLEIAKLMDRQNPR